MCTSVVAYLAVMKKKEKRLSLYNKSYFSWSFCFLRSPFAVPLGQPEHLRVFSVSPPESRLAESSAGGNHQKVSVQDTWLMSVNLDVQK